MFKNYNRYTYINDNNRKSRTLMVESIRIYLKYIGASTSFGLGSGLLDSPFECGIQPRISISHGVSEYVSE
jgi:hypothetical protein